MDEFAIPVTKFRPPRIRPETVARPHLIDQLRSSSAPLVLVTGPAGSGKSIALAQWYHDERTAVWMSLDDTDNDPAVFWSSLIDGLDQEIPGASAQIRRSLAATGGLTPNSAVAAVVNTLAEHGEPICIFIDDAHLIHDESCSASIERLSRRLPGGCRLIVASRSRHPFPVGKLRVEGGIVELDVNSLAMSDAEAAEFLAGLGIHVSTAHVAALNRRAEGWVAGLVMAALLLERYPDPEAVLGRFSGSDRGVAEYLISEVIENLPSSDRMFLLRTSILSRLTGDLCDAVSGLTGGASRLERLEQANAFVVPIDRQRRWYRYHHLFSQSLEDLLGRQRPDEVGHLHRRAFEWYRTHGMIVEAIDHALAAGLRHEAAVLLAGHWSDFANSGRIVTAGRLLDRFSADEVMAFPPLTLAAAWIKGVTGDPDASAILAAVEEGDHHAPPPDGSASMTSGLALARSVFGWDGVASSLADAELAYALESPQSRWRPVAAWLVADRHIWCDNWAAAKPFLDEVVNGPADQGVIRSLALAMLALWHLDRGETSAARDMSDAAYRLIEDAALGDIVTAGSVYAIRARVAQAAGDTAQAKTSLAAARGLVARSNRALPLGGIHAKILLADAALAVGDLRTAQENVAKASAVASTIPDVGALAVHLERIRRGVAEATATFSRRELDVVELLSADLTIREIGDSLFISRNTVKTHLRRLYKKLGVSSRAEAVEELRRLGLVPPRDADSISNGNGGYPPITTRW